jgi:hypothetical protein
MLLVPFPVHGGYSLHMLVIFEYMLDDVFGKLLLQIMLFSYREMIFVCFCRMPEGTRAVLNHLNPI